MRQLANLKNNQHRKTSRRVGRGPGSGVGKTCGRGQKGAGARSGHKHRWGTEGGQIPLYMKLPTRGFSNARFRSEYDIINLGDIDALYQDGETVNRETLRPHGYISAGKSKGLKILGKGELTKKVSIEAQAVSAGACKKLDDQKVSYTISKEL